MPVIHKLPVLLCGAALSCAAAISPAYFEPDWGQANRSAFLARAPGYTVLLQRNGAAAWYFPSGPGKAEDAVQMELLGGNRPVEAQGEQPLSSVTRYYRGNRPEMWRPEIPHYRNVRVRNVYPGIDLLWRTQGPDLEYDFAVSAGADPRRIRLRFRGARRLWIGRRGDLVVETRAGKLYHRRPVAWQEIAGRRVRVSARFCLRGGAAGFRLGPYRRRHRLWIDPVLSYATYLGGAGYDAGYAVAVDSAGNSYVAGTTGSLILSPQSSGLLPSRDAFVTKFNPDGSIAYTTLLSSSGDDYAYAVAVDAAGNVYVAGSAGGGDFPATPGVWQTASGGGEDGFAAKLDPAGRLVYASYIGGPGDDTATGIVADSSGNVYVSGYTASFAFPTTPGAPQPTYKGGPYDAFLLKLNASGYAVYATLLGGSGNDQASAVALDPAGNACIAGYTSSPDLPVLAALQPVYGGGGDALFACLNAAGNTWTAVSYLGGSGRDEAYALAAGAAGNLYLAGTTFSEDFPTTPGALAGAPARGYDAFVAKLNPGAYSLAYATLLGGTGSDAATTLSVGAAGDAWVAGYTASLDFPVTAAWQPAARGSFDGFVARLSADGTALLASSYLGGSGDDHIWGIAADSAGCMFVTGDTGSTNFPVTPGAAQSIAPAGYNAFLARIDPALTGYAISGQVTVSGVAPLSGLTVALSGAASSSTKTDASGSFTFNGLPAGGSYTVTPSAADYTFSPSGQTFQNLSANQTATFTASCPLSVSPAAVYLDSAGQAGPPLYVTAQSPGCLWVATATAGFIDIVSGTNGTGNGAVTFSVGANTAGADLTGALTVNGQAVSITQRATATTFTDVSPSGFYFDGANTLYSRGITGGCSANPLKYCPNDRITRGQMAVFIVTSIEGGNDFTYTATPYFTDVPPADPFFRFIQKLKDLGITIGCSATRFCPGAPITRGQMAVFLIAARYGAVPYSYPSTPYFTDVPPSSSFFPFIQKMAQVGITAGCGAGVYCPDQTLTRGQMAVFIAAGLLNQLPPGAPVVTSAAPASAAPGQTVTVTLAGSGTHFVQGATQVWTAPGITPSGIDVTGATGLTVQLTVSPGAAPGPSSIVVTTGTEEAVLPNGFKIQ
jgi:hypothetical protein